MRILCVASALLLLVPALAQETPGTNRDSIGARESEQRRLDELILEIALLKDDLAFQEKLRSPGGHPSHRVEMLIVRKALRLQTALAKARRERAFRWSDLRARFMTEVERPFILLRVRICQICNLAKSRGLLAELESQANGLDDLILEIALCEDDLAVHERTLEISNTSFIRGIGSVENALVQRLLELQASIAKVKRERMFRAPGQHGKFVALIEGPFIHLRERVRRSCDRPRFRGVFAERESLDLMLDEFAEGHYSNVIALWQALGEPGPDELERYQIPELRKQMKTLAAAASAKRCDKE